MNMQVWIGILLPFLGTSLGAAMVFVLKDQISDGMQRMLTGFAAGVMVAASFWSLLAPALESSEHMGRFAFVPAAVGFLVGIGFLLFLDTVTPHMHLDEQVEGPKSSLKRTTKLIPEMSEGEHSNVGTVAFALGFVLMMILDVALG